MTTAWIDGQPVSTGEAVREAAKLLSSSRFPLVWGSFDDASALREGARLASLAGGVIDHRDLPEIVPLIEALRDSGMIRVSPGEARRRADRVLVLGSDPFESRTELFEQIFSVRPDLGTAKEGAREIVLLGPASASAGAFASAEGEVRSIACPDGEIGDAVAILKAALAGRPFHDGPFEEGGARALAGWLKDAAFAAIVFDAARLDAIAIEAVAGLVSDLNTDTRASALPLAPGGAMGAAEAALWTSGFPLRTGFGRIDPEHDLVLNDADSLLSSGEADARLALCLGDARLGDHDVPTVLLTSGEGAETDRARIVFSVGEPGIDHGTVVHEARFGSFVSRPAERSSMLPNAADILSAIADEVGARVSSNDEARR